MRDLDVFYGRVQILFGLDLDVGAGETVAMLGTNGAGKTTLLRAISGLVAPARGSVVLGDTDLTRVGAEERARRGVVQVRGADVFPGLTVDENLRAALVAHPALREDAARRIDRVYDVFPALRAHRNQDAASLSGGEQQMVALAGALLFEPELLLVDELSLGLAPLVVQRLLDVLVELGAAGQAMLVVEQSLTVAAQLAERVVFLEKGTVRFDGPIADLTARDEFAGGLPGWRAMITVHGWDVSQQMVLSGVVQGLAYAVLAAGIVLVYRASGVINFAVAAFGTTAVALMGVLLGGGIGGWHSPFWLAFVLATIAAGAVGVLVEWSVIRRLADAPRLVLLVATIGIAQVLLLLALLLPAVGEGGFFPPLLDWTWTVSPELLIQGRELSVIVIVPVLVLALAVFLTRTRTGLMVRAAAANPDKARLAGIRVFRTSAVVWGISAAFAAVAAIALAPVRGISIAGAATAGGALSYQLLLRALVVALIARMRSLPVTLVAGIGVGIVEVILQQNVDPGDLGVTELWLFVATLVIVLVFSRLTRAPDDGGWKLVAGASTRVADPGAPWWSRHLSRAAVVALFAGLVLVPVVFSRASESFLWTRVLVFAIAGCSLTILTGWAGQLSLGQFGFAAIGGLTTVKLVGGDGVLGLHDLPWGAAVALGVLVGAAVAVLIGLPALRIPGLYLAVTTLAFAVFVSTWLVGQDSFVDLSGLLPTLAKPDAGVVDFASRRSYYFLCLAFLIACVAIVAQLRRTGIGRSTIAVSDNPASAAAMTISTTRMKLLAFAVSGGMAALAGCLLVTLLPSNTPAATFAPEESVRVVAIVVIGGLGALVGPVLGALWVIGVPAIWPDEPIVPFLVSGVGILAILLFFPGGFAGLLRAVEDRVLRLRREGRRPPRARTGGVRGCQSAGWRRRFGVGGGLAGGDGDDRALRRPGRGRPGRPAGRRGGVGRPDRHQRCRQEHVDERHRRVRARRWPGRGARP